MTDTFQKFLNQYNSSGRAKAEGYDITHFEGMTDQEKQKAFDLLSAEVAAPGVSEWLFYLDPAQAEPLILKTAIERKGEGLNRVPHLFASLFNNTENDVYAKPLVDSINDCLPKERKQTLWIIKGSKLPKIEKVDFYKKCLISPMDEVKRLAADFYLKEIEYKTQEPDDKSLSIKLKDKLVELPQQDKLKLFAELEQDLET